MTEPTEIVEQAHAVPEELIERVGPDVRAFTQMTTALVEQAEADEDISFDDPDLDWETAQAQLEASDELSTLLTEVHEQAAHLNEILPENYTTATGLAAIQLAVQWRDSEMDENP
jgi:hypothetical protein